jgi:hypothetical protein
MRPWCRYTAFPIACEHKLLDLLTVVVTVDFRQPEPQSSLPRGQSFQEATWLATASVATPRDRPKEDLRS